MKLLDGRVLAAGLLERCRQRADALAQRCGRRAGLAVVVAGGDAAAMRYAQRKAQRCREVGIDLQLHALEPQTTTRQALTLVEALNTDAALDGVFVQWPLAPGIDERAVCEAVAPGKDVDGVTSTNFAAMALGCGGVAACAAEAALQLLGDAGVALAGLRATVLDDQPSFGLPMAMLLLQAHATVTLCAADAADAPQRARAADLLITAGGRPGRIDSRWIRPGAVVIDGGYSQPGGGDVDATAARKHAAVFIPVPGGLGPMTIAILLEHTLAAAEQRAPPPA